MLTVGRPFDRTPLPGPARATGPTSQPSLDVSPTSLKNIFLLARPLYASLRCAAVSPPHTAFATAAISPRAPSSYATRSSLLPVARYGGINPYTLMAPHGPRQATWPNSPQRAARISELFGGPCGASRDYLLVKET
jgi:hypothetical protein